MVSFRIATPSRITEPLAIFGEFRRWLAVGSAAKKIRGVLSAVFLFERVGVQIGQRAASDSRARTKPLAA